MQSLPSNDRVPSSWGLLQRFCRLGSPGQSTVTIALVALTLLWHAPSACSQSTVSLGSDGAAQGQAVDLPLWLENGAQFAALQVDLTLDPVFVDASKMSVKSALTNALVDGGVVAPDRYRVVLLSTNREPLPTGEAARITFAAHSNSPNGLLRVALRTPPGATAVSVTTNGTCSGGLTFQPGQFLVGDAFAFMDGIGRVQFRTSEGATNVVMASTNLTTWLAIGTNVGLNELVVWMDTDVTNYAHRFYKAKAP